MFGIRSYIRQQKAKFRRFKTEKGQLENIKKAEELEALKKERIRLEGKARLEKSRTKEVGRIRGARKDTSKVRRFAKGLQKTMGKGKEELQKRKKEGKGIDFGGGSSSVGIDFGLGSSSGGTGGSPFDLGKKEEKPKPKQTTITIKV